MLEFNGKNAMSRAKMNPNKPTTLDFFEFVYDRHLIWYKRFVLKQKSPWTKDPILSLYRFCNVYRELDRCSIHLIDNVIDNKELNLSDKIFNILVYRRFNTPYFYNHIQPIKLEHFHWKDLELLMDRMKKDGLNLFNSAYIICQRSYASKYRKSDKHIQQLLLIEEIKNKSLNTIILSLKENKIEELHKCLNVMIPLTGNFLAFQYCTDITYLPEFKNKFKDIGNFVSVGPGAKPAIDLLFPNTKLPYDTNCKLLFDGQKLDFNKLKIRTGKDWNEIYYKYAYFKSPYLSLSNIQNSLCEFRKYCHLQTNPKKRKRIYREEKNNG